MKATPHRLSSGKLDFPEMAKDIAAFANAVGGTILVGAQENPSTNVCAGYNHQLTETDVKDICDGYGRAGVDFCSPTPFLDARPLLNPLASAWVAAINVYAFPSQAIGARTRDSNAHGPWLFPFRVGRDTRFIRPEQLAMLMDPVSRRIATLLDSINMEERNQLHVQTRQKLLEFALVGVKILENAVCFRGAGRSRPYPCDIPLDAVKQVWRASDGRWHVVLDCNVQEDVRDEVYRYIPPLSF